MTLLTKRLNAVVNFVFSSFKEINNVFSHINRNGFGVKSFRKTSNNIVHQQEAQRVWTNPFQCARQCRPTHSIKDLNIHSATYEYFWCWTYLITHRHPVCFSFVGGGHHSRLVDCHNKSQCLRLSLDERHPLALLKCTSASSCHRPCTLTWKIPSCVPGKESSLYTLNTIT